MLHSHFSHRYTTRAAFTLIEALIAVAVTMMMMLALSTGFASMSQTISDGRARLNLSDQLRGVTGVIREDLDGVTVAGEIDQMQDQMGYLDYFDGPLNRFSATLATFDPTFESYEEKVPGSRWGDVDDILAFTTKARPGQWFYGQVPFPIVDAHVQVMNASGPVDLSTLAYSPEQWARSVTVASQYAEVVYYVNPWGTSPDTYFEYDAAGSIQYGSNGVANKAYPISFANEPIGVTPAPTAPLLPNRLTLCRRVLLVLPSLNIPADKIDTSSGSYVAEDQLFWHPVGGSGGPAYTDMLLADPLRDGSGNNSYFGFKHGLQHAYQRCDISVRRVGDNTPGSFDPIAANTLADLADPRNRFAHCVLPFAADDSTDTTMPIWGLTGVIAGSAQAVFANGGASPFTGSPQPAREEGFIPPQFYRQRRLDNDPSGESIDFRIDHSEAMATNLLGFDVRYFDTNVRTLYHPGPDKLPGMALLDDDGLNGVDDAGELGFAGSDDMALLPSDLSYPVAVQYQLDYSNAMGGGAAPADAFVAASGGFVDAGWPAKLIAHVAQPAAAPKYSLQSDKNLGDQLGNSFSDSPASGTFLRERWDTDNNFIATGGYGSDLNNTVAYRFNPNLLSPFGWTATNLQASETFFLTESAFKSGRAMYLNEVLRVYQPGYDTFTNRYESDGYIQQHEFTSLESRGCVWVNGVNGISSTSMPSPTGGVRHSFNPALQASGFDQGYNNLDDNGVGGPDDAAERETSPPVTLPLRAVRIDIRVGDDSAAAVQELSVVKDLSR